MEWNTVVEAGAAQIVHAVRAVADEHPGKKIYGAMFHAFYGDGDVIYWPSVAVGTEESLARVVAYYAEKFGDTEDLERSLRWAGPDLEYGFDPSVAEQAVADEVQAEAGLTGQFEKWSRAYERFLACFPKAAKLARKQLIAEGVVGKEFIAVAADEEGDLIPPSLTKAQLRKHFPEYDAAEIERSRLAALPAEERIPELLPYALGMRFDGLLNDYDELLKADGEAVVLALTRVLQGRNFVDKERDRRWKASKLLAEIGIADPETIHALEALMLEDGADENSRAWAACALSRLGRPDLVIDRILELPEDVAVRGIVAPYTSFRNYGAHGQLDYRPIEEAIQRFPRLEPLLEEELSPGSGYCALEPDEYDIARAALDSPYEVIRTHARIALENAGEKPE